MKPGYCFPVFVFSATGARAEANDCTQFGVNSRAGQVLYWKHPQSFPVEGRLCVRRFRISVRVRVFQPFVLFPALPSLPATPETFMTIAMWLKVWNGLGFLDGTEFTLLFPLVLRSYFKIQQLYFAKCYYHYDLFFPPLWTTTCLFVRNEWVPFRSKCCKRHSSRKLKNKTNILKSSSKNGWHKSSVCDSYFHSSKKKTI